MMKKVKKITKKSLVTLIELPPTQFGVLNGEPSYDEYSLLRLPPRAIHKLKAVLKAEGWGNVYCMHPYFHGKKGRFSEENLRLIFNSDVIGLSGITRTMPQLIKLAQLYQLNKANPNGKVIAGGPGPTAMYEECLDKGVDVVVKKEALRSLPLLMERFIEDSENLEGIEGIAFRKNGEIVTSEPRFLTSEELSNLPYPDYDFKTIKGVSVASIETTTGCPHNCPYCSVTDFYGKKVRTKSIDYVVGELGMLYEIGMGRSIFFSDDNFFANPKHALSRLEAITDAGLNTKSGGIQTTVQIAEKEQLLEALKKANVAYLFVGLESTNGENLDYIEKPYTVEQNEKAVKIFRDEGFWIHGLMMIGGKDTKKTLKEMLKWSKEYLHSVEFFPIGALPGTRFYEKMSEENRILTKDWFLYDGHHVVLRPENLTPYELQKIEFEMYYDFYSFPSNIKRMLNSPKPKTSFGILLYTNLKRGIARTFKSKQMQQHLEFLKSVS